MSAKGSKSASQAAVLAGIMSFDMGNKADAKMWFGRVTDKTFAFDRDLLLAKLALSEDDFKDAR